MGRVLEHEIIQELRKKTKQEEHKKKIQLNHKKNVEYKKAKIEAYKCLAKPFHSNPVVDNPYFCKNPKPYQGGGFSPK